MAPQIRLFSRLIPITRTVTRAPRGGLPRFLAIGQKPDDRIVVPARKQVLHLGCSVVERFEYILDLLELMLAQTCHRQSAGSIPVIILCRIFPMQAYRIYTMFYYSLQAAPAGSID